MTITTFFCILLQEKAENLKIYELCGFCMVEILLLCFYFKIIKHIKDRLFFFPDKKCSEIQCKFILLNIPIHLFLVSSVCLYLSPDVLFVAPVSVSIHSAGDVTETDAQNFFQEAEGR